MVTDRRARAMLVDAANRGPVLAVVLSTEVAIAHTLPWRPNEPAPPGYHLDHKLRASFFISGALVSALGYGMSLVFAFGNEWKGTSPILAVPMVGSFIVAVDDANHRDLCPVHIPTNDCHAFAVDPILIAQSAGRAQRNPSIGIDALLKFRAAAALRRGGSANPPPRVE